MLVSLVLVIILAAFFLTIILPSLVFQPLQPLADATSRAMKSLAS